MGGKQKRRFSIIHFALVAVIFVLAGFYTFQTNSSIEEKFSISSLSDEIYVLSEEHKSLSVELSQKSSLGAIKSLSSELQLEEAKDISYIQVKKESPLVLGN